jgi:hypothetical protein
VESVEEEVEVEVESNKGCVQDLLAVVLGESSSMKLARHIDTSISI